MICKLIRFMISDVLDSDRELSVFVKWHMKRCPDCRQFHAMSQSLTHRLIADASDSAPISDVATAAVFPSRVKPTLAFAAIFICLTVAGFVALNRSGVSDQDVRYFWLADAVDELSAMGETIVLDNPFEQELTFVVEDTKGAINALIACTGLDADYLLLVAAPETWAGDS